jgi:UDP-N-acetylglucosamine 2-epimerase
MKVLRVHAPGTDPVLAGHVTAAVRTFNAELDIRLRFLAIGIEERVLDVQDAAGAAEQVGAALGGAQDASEATASGPDGAPAPTTDAVLLLGGGEAAVAAAATAARARVPVVRVGAGARGEGADAARAVDRLAAVRLAHDDLALQALREEGLGEASETVGAPGDPASGERIVRALSRARRR